MGSANLEGLAQRLDGQLMDLDVGGRPKGVQDPIGNVVRTEHGQSTVSSGQDLRISYPRCDALRRENIIISNHYYF